MIQSHLRVWWLVVALTVLGVGSHLIPHDMGVSTVGAISMLAAAYLPASLALLPVFITVAVADLVNGTYALLAMTFVYLAYLSAAVVVRPVLRQTRWQHIGLAALLNAVVFYLVSNLTPMAMGYYPVTFAGWFDCYVNGLPFLWRGILANLVFGGIAFGAIKLYRMSRAHRFAAAQRH